MALVMPAMAGVCWMAASHPASKAAIFCAALRQRRLFTKIGGIDLFAGIDEGVLWAMTLSMPNAPLWKVRKIE